MGRIESVKEGERQRKKRRKGKDREKAKKGERQRKSEEMGKIEKKRRKGERNYWEIKGMEENRKNSKLTIKKVQRKRGKERLSIVKERKIKRNERNVKKQKSTQCCKQKEKGK